MTIGASPSLGAVNSELGRTAGTIISMDDSSMRELAQVSLTAGVPWGMASLIGKTGANVSLTVGKHPSLGIYGYDSGLPYGSVAPSTIGLGTVRFITGGGAGDLSFAINGVFAQSAWRALQFLANVNAGPFATAYSASAGSFSVVASTYSQWIFGSSSIAGLNLPSLNGQTIIVRALY